MKHLLLPALALITLCSHAQDTGGWKTILATKKELKDFPPGQVDLEDGLLHVRSGTGILIPQPTPDGAIRARFHFIERTGFPQLRIRRGAPGNVQKTDYYEIILYVREGIPSVQQGLVNVTTNGKGRGLGTFPLPEPFALGAVVDLELSVMGDHVQVLVNGKLGFEIHDSTVANGGFWGVAAQEAWFSNVQVRSFPPGSRPAPKAMAAPAAPPVQLKKSTDPRIIQLQEAYMAAIERDITPGHLEAVKTLDAKYAAALDRALEGTTQAGSLDAALALRSEKKRVEDHAPLPAEDSAATEPLNTLRMTYRNSLSQLNAQRDQRVQPLHEKYLQALAAYQDELTRAKDLDAAIEVRKFREAEAGGGKAK